MININFTEAPEGCNASWKPPISLETSLLHHNCSIPLHKIQPVLSPLIQSLSLLNFFLHLGSLMVFVQIFRSKGSCQVIHYYLIFLSIYEIGLMFCNFIKQPLHASGWILSTASVYTSPRQLETAYQFTMVIKVLSTCFSCCRNWWLVVIALLRCITIVRLAFRQGSVGKESIGSALGNIVCLFVLVNLVIVTVFGVIYGYILPRGLTIIYCQIAEKSIVIYGFRKRKFNNRVALDLIHELIFFILPFSIMLMGTLVLWVALRQLNRASLLRSQVNMRIAAISKTVGILMSVFLLLELPFSVTLLVSHLGLGSWCARHVSLKLAKIISDFMSDFDSTANILVYYYWDPTYQRICRNVWQRVYTALACKHQQNMSEREEFSLIETGKGAISLKTAISKQSDEPSYS